MKVLILLSRIDQTGMTTNTLDLVNGLALENKQVYLITGGPVEKNNVQIDNIYNDFKKVCTVVDTFNTYRKPKLFKIFISLLLLPNIGYWILRIKPNVIHVQSPYMSFIPWMLGRKFTSTLHVNDLRKTFKYKKATHLIAISKETKAYAMDLFDYKEASITIVNHGVSEKFAIKMNMEERKAFKQSKNIPLQKIIIGFVGSIEKRKGHDILLKAVAGMDQSIKDKIHVVLVGSSKNNNTRPWLDNLIEENEVADLVSCFEYQDPQPFYDVFDIFVLPSRLEGFGLVVIEAMMSECCAIRSNTEGAYDQISHGEDGFLFQNNDHEELKILLEKVILDEPLRLELARKAKEKALKKFTIKEMTNNTLEVYKKLC